MAEVQADEESDDDDVPHPEVDDARIPPPFGSPTLGNVLYILEQPWVCAPIPPLPMNRSKALLAPPILKFWTMSGGGAGY